jgi:competence protein ComGC
MNKNKVRNKLKATKGITLIALVITIIVLLILAAVSIATLTGENGILSKANTAKTETEKAGAKEKVQMAVMSSFDDIGKLDYTELKTNLDNVEGIDKKTVPPTITEDIFAFTVNVDGYDVKIDENGKVTVEGESTGGNPTPNPPTSNLPSTDDTKPYLPEGATVDEEHNTLENGLVIKDASNNEWVWIEVPKSIYTNTTYNGGTAPTSAEDYAKIESTMQAYASAYRKNGYTDTFDSTEQHGFADATEYNNWKNSMLKSVYEKGGFYIGRYEVGTETARLSGSNALTTPIIQRDKYPYNFVTCSQAQTLAKQLATGGKQGSLMFGIQWDLVLKFIEEKGAKTQAELKVDSSSWGNYKDVSFDIKREQGLYTISPNSSGSWKTTSNYTKPSSKALLTTGATDRNSALGIYDLAGNVYEWTLENSTDTYSPCAIRGGHYGYNGSDHPASGRSYCSPAAAGYSIGGRPALW